MLLMTKDPEKKFGKYPLYSQEDKGEKQEDGDWLFYGYCHLFEWEWGYALLSELEDDTLPFGLKIEREQYVTGGKVKDYISEEEME